MDARAIEYVLDLDFLEVNDKLKDKIENKEFDYSKFISLEDKYKGLNKLNTNFRLVLKMIIDMMEFTLICRDEYDDKTFYEIIPEENRDYKNDKYRIIDNQGASLGNIETFCFSNVRELFNELENYFKDYELI